MPGQQAGVSRRPFRRRTLARLLRIILRPRAFARSVRASLTVAIGVALLVREDPHVTDSSLLPSSTQNGTGLSAVLAQMGAVLLSTQTINTTVELVTSLAAETIPNTEGAGVSLVDSRGKRSVAASNGLVERVDALQYELGAGPCLTSWQDQMLVRIDDVRQEDRWPEWTAAVSELGVRAVLSVPLVAADTCIGAIKVYSLEPAAFDDRAEHLLQLFARQAAILLGNAQTLADAQRTNVQLTHALKSRDVIGQAKGILLAQGAQDDAAAFAMLVWESSRANLKLHTVAEQLVAAVTTRNQARSGDRA
jgi:GAF domain-containing protein